MKINKAIICLLTLTLFSCSFVSCGDSGNSSDDKKASVSEQSKTKSAEESKIIGTWEFDPEYYEEIVFEGVKPTLYRLKLTEDNKAVLLLEMDYSEYMYLTDKKLYVDGHGCKIKSFDRKELVIEDGGEEITFVRTEQAGTKYGEYELPEDWLEELGADKCTIIFEENENTKLKAYWLGEYEYDNESGELFLDVNLPYDEEEEDDDDNGPPTVEFLDEDTILLHGSDGEDLKMFRVK